MCCEDPTRVKCSAFGWSDPHFDVTTLFADAQEGVYFGSFMKIPRLLPPILCLALSVASADNPDVIHPDFELCEAKMPAKYKTMGLAFLTDGTLVLATTETVGGGEVPAVDPGHQVFLFRGISPDSLPVVEEISNSWNQIAGIAVAQDRVFVSDREGFFEIPELKKPALPAANRRLVVKWPDEGDWNNGPFWHQWVFTPVYRNGWFYAPFSGSIRPGGWSNVDPTSSLSGAFLKWDLQGNLSAIAGGLRSPNGANADPATGEIFVTDNQGSWLPSSTFMRIRQDRFYGHRQSTPDLDTEGNLLGTHPANFAEGLPYEPPVAWLPHGSVRSSPSQPIAIPPGQGRFSGDWLIGDVNNPGLVRVALDRVGEACNGAVFWFGNGMGAAAINRMAAAPDGSIVIGTLTRIGGNWPSGDKSPLFLLKAREEAAAFDFKAVRALADGVELEFTQPVNPDSVSPGHFQVKSWRYIRQKEYGLGRGTDETRTVLAAEASKDRKRVHLVLSGLAEDRVLHIKAVGLPSSGGKELWSNESWFTLNAISARTWDPGLPTAAAPKVAAPALSITAMARQGILEVAFDRPGSSRTSAASQPVVDAALYSLTGAKLAEASGNPGGAPLRFARPGAGPGVYLLKARARGAAGSLGNGSATLRVCF